MDSDLRLSLCTITKDDEEYISKWISHFKEVIDEIIIIDLGSKDSTVDIAKEYGVAVIETEFKNDYSTIKNLCMEAAKGRWILFLQPNELIETDKISEIYKLLQNPTIEGYLLYIDNPNASNRILSPVHLLRLLRNRKEYRFKYKVFERIPDEILNNIGNSNITIKQNGILKSSLDKNAALNLLKKELDNYPSDSYLNYIFGLELLNLKRFDESIDYFKKSLKNINHEYLFATHLLKCLGWAYLTLKKYTDAEDILNEGIKVFPDYTDYYVLRSEIKKREKNYIEAIRDLESALLIRSQHNLRVPSQEISSSIIFEELGDLHKDIFNFKQALLSYQQSFELNKENNKIKNKINELVNLLEIGAKLNDAETVKTIYESIEDKHIQVEFRRKMGHILALSGNIEAAEYLLYLEDSIEMKPIEYVIWSKKFINKLKAWKEAVTINFFDNTKADIEETPLVINNDLIIFYECLGYDLNNHDNNEYNLRNAEIHCNIGDYYIKEEKRREALIAYLRSIQWMPIYDKAMNKIISLNNEDPDLLIDIISMEDLILEGNNFTSKEEFKDYIVGCIYFYKNQIDKALLSFKKIQEINLSNKSLDIYLYCCLWILGKVDEIEKLLNKDKMIDNVKADSIFLICIKYALSKIVEGLKEFPYSELLKYEKNNIEYMLNQ